MENSIEEDIILLKDFTEGNFKRDKLENYKGSYKMGYFYYKDIQQAIEHILSDYKRVLKENEELRAKWDKDTHILQNELDYANADKIDLIQQNEELKHKIEGQECVIETQAHNEEVYERTFARLEKENKELKEEKDVDYTTVYLKGIYDERERWDLKVKGNIKKYRKLADETYKIFRESNSKDRDSHDAGLYFDGHVSALEEII